MTITVFVELGLRAGSMRKAAYICNLPTVLSGG